MFMKTLKKLSAIAVLLGAVNAAQAVTIQVKITNLTQGMHFTPRLLVAHTDAVDLFEAGEAPSTPLAWVAEAGVIGMPALDDSPAGAEDFASYLEDASRAANNAWQQFGGLLAPATTSMDYTFDTENHPYLSMVSMLVPTNDAFVGLDSWRIPTTSGTYVINLNAYDAGSEGNDEINPTRSDITEAGTGDALGGYGVPGMAAPPPTQPALGTGGAGVALQIDANNQIADGADTREGIVHIHRNVLGDTDNTAGVSDLDATVHRWLNPVARITVIVP